MILVFCGSSVMAYGLRFHEGRGQQKSGKNAAEFTASGTMPSTPGNTSKGLLRMYAILNKQTIHQPLLDSSLVWFKEQEKRRRKDSQDEWHCNYHARPKKISFFSKRCLFIKGL